MGPAPRPSSRRHDEMRRVSLEPGVLKHAEGSCLVKFGDTHVLCTASLENQAPSFLRGSGRGTSDRSSLAQRALLVLQATLSVVLVAGATMLGRSLSKLENQSLGYQTKGRVLVSLNRPPSSYTQPRLAAVYRQLEDRLTRLPGVTGAGLALTQHVLHWAHENGYPVMTIDWRMTNLLASRFWPRRGFRPTFLRLYRALP